MMGGDVASHRQKELITAHKAATVLSTLDSVRRPFRRYIEADRRNIAPGFADPVFP